jgi:hypothetical protein
MTHAQAQEIWRLASRLATARVRFYAVRNVRPDNNETEAGTAASVERTSTELRKYLEELTHG